MENEPKKEIQWDLRELYKTRVIVLLESEPLSNKYRQIVFTHVQFQLFVAFMNSLFPIHKGPTMPGQPTFIDIAVSRDPNLISLPENIQDHIPL